MLRQHVAKEQFGVQIVYKNPKAAGADPEREPSWYWFDHIEQADHFAERPAHEMRTPGEYGGVKEVNRAERWAIEVYGEANHTGQSVSCWLTSSRAAVSRGSVPTSQGPQRPHDS